MIQKILPTAPPGDAARVEALRFIVVVPMYNAERWIGGNIDILKRQTHANFRCMIGDDLSADGGATVAEARIRGDSRFTLIRNDRKRFGIGNALGLVAASGARPEDVIVIVDGDDRLAHEEVLRRVAETYVRQDCWLTYGSYSTDGVTRDAVCRPYSGWVRRFNLFRRVKWRPVHLRTFRHALLRHVPEGHLTIAEPEIEAARRRAMLRGRWRSWAAWRRIALPALVSDDGRFTRRCCDRVLLLSLLELAGSRSCFLPEVHYIYNRYDRELNYGEKAVHQKWYTRLIREAVVHKARLEPLLHLGVG